MHIDTKDRMNSIKKPSPGLGKKWVQNNVMSIWIELYRVVTGLKFPIAPKDGGTHFTSKLSLYNYSPEVSISVAIMICIPPTTHMCQYLFLLPSHKNK